VITLFRQLEEEKFDLEEINKEYEIKVKELSDENARKNKETTENLKTLLKEMTYIEESNESLQQELEKQKNYEFRISRKSFSF